MPLFFHDFLFLRLRWLTQRSSGYSRRRPTSWATELQKDPHTPSHLPVRLIHTTSSISFMSLRFSRSQNVLRSLSFQSSRRGLSNVSLLRTESPSHLGQTHLTCGRARRFKSTYVEALKVVQDPVTQKSASISDIEVRLDSPGLMIHLPPAVASETGDSSAGITETSSEAFGTCVWRKYREPAASECLFGDNADNQFSDRPHADHPVERRFRLGDPENCSMCAE